MITKILFTIAIIASVMLVSRHLGQRQGTAGRKASPPSGAIRIAAYSVIVLVVLAAGLWLVLEWRSAHEILQVQVVNSATGTTVQYEAYRRDIESRSFRTLDGRLVNLAEVERLEVGGR